jgi:hypothetical protein
MNPGNQQFFAIDKTDEEKAEIKRFYGEKAFNKIAGTNAK